MTAIYVNRGGASRSCTTRCIDTGGISVRSARSDAAIEGKLIDGLLRARDGARIRANDNFGTRATQLYAGTHPVRALFRDLRSGRLNWNGAPPRRMAPATGNDLCDSRRPARAGYGAIEDLASVPGAHECC
jgi:hypothetical protein